MKDRPVNAPLVKVPPERRRCETASRKAAALTECRPLRNRFLKGGGVAAEQPLCNRLPPTERPDRAPPVVYPLATRQRPDRALPIV